MIRLCCFFCGKSISTEVPNDTIVRAICVCPECVPAVIRDDAPSIERDAHRAAAIMSREDGSWL
jgi:hypothetical protein